MDGRTDPDYRKASLINRQGETYQCFIFEEKDNELIAFIIEIHFNPKTFVSRPNNALSGT